MKIGIISTGKKADRAGSVMQQAAQLLIERGASVDFIYPEEQAIDLARVRIEHDFYLLKSGTEAAMCLAGALDVAGAKILNPYPAAVRMKNKVLATKVMQAAGVPLPETYVATQPQQLAEYLKDGPLVLKPYWGGSQGRGVQVISRAEELSEMAPEQGLLFAQRYHRPDGRDHKLYSLGELIFGVWRVWPARTYEEKLGEPFTVSPEMGEIVRACGRAFGVDLFGLDVIFSDGRPYVVDINALPGFKGVPDAALHLANYIYAAAAACVRQ